MRKIKYLLIVSLFFMFTNLCFAYDPNPSDLQLENCNDYTGDYKSGDIVKFKITVRNNNNSAMDAYNGNDFHYIRLKKASGDGTNIEYDDMYYLDNSNNKLHELNSLNISDNYVFVPFNKRLVIEGSLKAASKSGQCKMTFKFKNKSEQDILDYVLMYDSTSIVKGSKYYPLIESISYDGSLYANCTGMDVGNYYYEDCQIEYKRPEDADFKEYNGPIDVENLPEAKEILFRASATFSNKGKKYTSEYRNFCLPAPLPLPYATQIQAKQKNGNTYGVYNYITNISWDYNSNIAVKYWELKTVDLDGNKSTTTLNPSINYNSYSCEFTAPKRYSKVSIVPIDYDHTEGVSFPVQISYTNNGWPGAPGGNGGQPGER